MKPALKKLTPPIYAALYLLRKGPTTLPDIRRHLRDVVYEKRKTKRDIEQALPTIIQRGYASQDGFNKANRALYSLTPQGEILTKSLRTKLFALGLPLFEEQT